MRIRLKKHLAAPIVLLAAMLSPVAVGQEVGRTQEKFTRTDRARGATVELRPESTIYGNEIRFGQIARWADADKDVFEPLSQLIVARFGDKQAVRGIGIVELRSLLRDAGVNTSMMNFTGSLACTITRSDTQVSNPDKLDQLIDAQDTKSPQLVADPTKPRIDSPAADVKVNATNATASTVKFEDKPQPAAQSLRDRLTSDLASRLQIPVETLQITFRAEDDRVLRLAEPQFRFSITGQRVGNLGDVSWQVSIATDKGSTRSFIQARAQAWQDQVVVTRPLASKQLITDADVVERRSLVDRISEDVLLKRDQLVGQQASRDLKSGTVMTARLVDPVQLVRSGQFVSIEHAVGNVKIKIVARAMEGGCFGQSIRVKNETTRETLRVIVTGPQTASVNTTATLSDPVAMNRG